MLPSLVLIDVGLNNPLKPSIATRTFNLWGYDVTTKKGLDVYLFSAFSISSSNTEVISVANLDLTRPCDKQTII